MSAQSNSSVVPVLLTGGLTAMKIGPWENPVQDWSWWWVTAPLWIGFALAAVILVICGIAYTTAAIFGSK